MPSHILVGNLLHKLTGVSPHPAALLHSATQCHRRNEDARDVAYPVHAIEFHPEFGTFATGGGDGVINTWDGENKKRLFQISK